MLLHVENTLADAEYAVWNLIKSVNSSFKSTLVSLLNLELIDDTRSLCVVALVDNVVVPVEMSLTIPL